MDPRDYWSAIRKSWIVIIVLGVVGVLVGVGYGHTKPNVYQSSSTLFVTAAQGSNVDELAQGATYMHNLVTSYPGLATTPAVLTPVISNLNLQTTPTALARQITATNPLNTWFVQVTVSDGSATRSAAIANAVARSLRTVATNLVPASQSGGHSVTISIVTPAQAPLGARSPNRHLIDITAGIIGLAVGVLVAIARLLFDTRLRTARDVETATDAPVVGTVRRRGREEPAGVALVASPDGGAAEDYRRIRATLQFATGTGSLSSLLVTSPLAGPDTTELVLDVSLATAERARSVLVIDANLRRPEIEAVTGLGAGRGLTDVIEGSVSLADAVRSWEGGVDVLTSGPTHSNPHFVLGSDALVRVVTEAKAAYDFVVLAGPAVLTASDALALAHLVEGTLVVATAKKTTRQQLVRALDSLESVRAGILGVVLVDVRQKARAERPVSGSAPAEGASAQPTGFAQQAAASASASAAARRGGSDADGSENEDTGASGAKARARRTNQLSPGDIDASVR